MQATKKADKSPASALPVSSPLQVRRESALRRFLRRVPWRFVGPILSIALFVGALAVLASILHEVDPENVVTAFTAMPTSVILLSDPVHLPVLPRAHRL